MSLISGNGLCKSYGFQDVFQNISFSIPQGARIGLVGSNGIGKSTFLRVIIGLEEASGGSVQRSRGLRIGYLSQGASFDEAAGTLKDLCLDVFSDLISRRQSLAALEESLSQAPADSSLLDVYGIQQREFENLGGYTFEERIHQTLQGLGFTLRDEQRQLVQLSGGQQTRAQLARLLLSNPDLLLMDEPTNHLDVMAIEWLEEFLRTWEGAVLIVSHDRYFLDQVVGTIWELSPALEIYRGNYSAYIAQRAERYRQQLDEYQSQTAFIEKEEEYIRRNIAGQNTRQAQGRRKRLERMLEEARLTPPHQPRSMRFLMQPQLRSGDLVLRTFNLQVGYPEEQPLFSASDLTLVRGECAAILGPNGAGKTTFLKTLLGQVNPWRGEVLFGASLKVGYFSQAHESLHLQWNLMQEIEALAPQLRPAEIRDYLARFLFIADDVFKNINDLSGGERGRLALACLGLTNANLLLLDEPTNHLDLLAQDGLQSVLADFNGTILLVSHDRYLIDALATQIWDVIPDEKALRIFQGGYSAYRASRQMPADRPVEKIAVQGEKKHPIASTPAQKKPDRKRLLYLQELEKKITSLEEGLAFLAHRLETPPADPSEVHRLGVEYVQLQKSLEQLMDEWAALAE